ncbi:phytoene/squalene synthase family protein [Marinilabiliaceae bacterium ANBcel2]|nr:phytoene/squalene synthase family protein [Marinilabiliaceae bacterium ANBcel2]
MKLTPIELYRHNNLKCSRNTTKTYSTSFSLGVRMLKKEYRNHIYSLYGFVRYADEIVDSLNQFNQERLLHEFKEDTYKAIKRGVSTNPLLDSFQHTVNSCKIDHSLIDSFLKSMEMDLTQKYFSQRDLNDYIYGSAEVVGLMCLKVFYYNNSKEYDRLQYPARKLGEAFQKVNFLRDAEDDFVNKGRVYFKDIDFSNFNHQTKEEIERQIEQDFKEAYPGIVALRKDVRFGVYLAYRYYLSLFKKIKKAPPRAILLKRYRISNTQKSFLLLKVAIKNSLGVF